MSPFVQNYYHPSGSWPSEEAKFSYHNMLNHKRDEHHGYILPFNYSGQQGAGIQALISLQCWVAYFNLPMQIIEPVLSDTMFYSISPSHEETALTFSDIFDIQHFNRISETLGYTPMATREEFFSDVPTRDAIFMSTARMRTSSKVIWNADSRPDGKRNCFHFEDEYKEIRMLIQKYGFCFVRVVEVPYNHKNASISDNDVRMIFGDLLPQHVTLVFQKWNTRWYSVNDDLGNPSKCKGVGTNSTKKQFLPSSRLLSDAEYYETHFLNSSNDVALMLRIERMMQFLTEEGHTSTMWVDKCLRDAVRLTRDKQTSGYPMVTLDLGMFGSSSLNISKYISEDIEALTRKSKVLLTNLYNNKVTFEEWETSFTKATGGVKNNGYIAALQRTLASRAKCLILVGGGNFQDLALKDYLKNHPNREDQCIHLVCALNEGDLNKAINGY